MGHVNGTGLISVAFAPIMRPVPFTCLPPQVLGATLYHALDVPLDSKVGARSITTGEPIHQLFS